MSFPAFQDRLINLLPVIPISLIVYKVRETTTRHIGLFFLKRGGLDEKIIPKLEDSIYFCVQYTLLVILSGWALSRSGYFEDRLKMFRSLPNELTPGATFCYVTELAVYVSGSLVLMSPKDATSRKHYSDEGKMWIHHGLTLSLLLISYLSGHTIIGLLVMHLHDMCDIIIEFTKTLKYIVGIRFVTICLFLVILAVFLYNRGYIFVRDVLLNILTGYPRALSEFYTGPVKVIERSEYGSGLSYVAAVMRNFTKFPVSMIVCELLLMGLEVLNVMWIIDLVQILLHYVRTGVAGDIRDPDERDEMKSAELKGNKEGKNRKRKNGEKGKEIRRIEGR